MEIGSQTMRLDIWLWAARFFKTRSMATKAINGGKVHLNGNRVKAAHGVSAGDQLRVTIGFQEFTVTVQGLARMRRPAKEARLLYSESEESIAAREEQRELRRLAGAGYTAPARRPNKRDRRKIKFFTGRDGEE